MEHKKYKLVQHCTFASTCNLPNAKPQTKHSSGDHELIQQNSLLSLSKLKAIQNQRALG